MSKTLLFFFGAVVHNKYYKMQSPSVRCSFDFKSTPNVIRERERWDAHTKQIMEDDMEMRSPEYIAGSTRERLKFRSEMHSAIKQGVDATSSLSRAIRSSHSDVYRRAVVDMEEQLKALRDREIKDTIIENCMVQNEQYFKNVNLTLRLTAGMQSREHRFGTVSSKTLEAYLLPEQMNFFNKVREFGVIINKCIYEQNNAYLSSPKNVVEALTSMFEQYLKKACADTRSPVIHLSLTHDSVVDYAEVERATTESISNGAHVNLSFETKSPRAAFANCIVDFAIDPPPNMMPFLDVVDTIVQAGDTNALKRACCDYTLYYNFGEFYLNMAVLESCLVKGGKDEFQTCSAKWFQTFRDSVLRDHLEKTDLETHRAKLSAFDTCASSLPIMKPYYMAAPRVVVFHFKKNRSQRKIWFSLDSDWPGSFSDARSYVLDVLNKYKHKTENVVMAVPNVPAKFSYDKCASFLENRGNEIYTRPVKGGVCVARFYLDSTKPTKMVVC